MKSEEIMLIKQMMDVGITVSDIVKLRRISKTLRRWHELECGVDGGCIQRDEETGIPYFYNSRASYLDPHDTRYRSRIADREKGALKRLEKIMSAYPDMSYRVQGDPRGQALYLHHDGREFAVY